MRVVGFIWLLAGIAGFFIYLCHQHWNWTWDWNMLGVFATWVLAGGIFFVFWQIMEARRSTNAEVAVGLSQELRDKDVLNTLREIYEHKPSDLKRLVNSSKENDKELRHRIEHVLDKLELLGALAAQGIIEEQIAIEVYGGPTALKCWYQLQEFIDGVRADRGIFCKYVQDFTKRTLKFQIKHYPKEQWTRFHRGDKGGWENVIEELLKGELLSPCEQKQAMFFRHLRSIYKPALRKKM